MSGAVQTPTKLRGATRSSTTQDRASADAAGRVCPVHYLYAPTSLARAAQLHAETLYVVGGLYGNPFALDALQALIAIEPGPVQVVSNGNFHWFDRDGNVETQFGALDDAAGCGCAYPEWVDDIVVERSNTIEVALRCTARQLPRLKQQMADLPMNLVAQVGDARIAIVHGDGVSLAAWVFSRRTLATDRGAQRAAQWLQAANADVFACTHTCEPLLLALNTATSAGATSAATTKGSPGHGARHGVIINNGAAGMPNFRNSRAGVITQIAGVHVDSVALPYEHHQWWSLFESLWPPNSPARLSYSARIRDGGELDLAQAMINH
jgi:hypothetical protein